MEAIMNRLNLLEPMAFCLLLALGTVTAPPAAGQTYTASWTESMNGEFETAYKHVSAVSAELDRLDKEFDRSQSAILANPKCADLDCETLRRLAEIADQADAAARTAELLGYIALEQRKQEVDYAKEAASGIRKGRDKLATILLAQEFALGTAELSFSIALSLATGDPTNAASGFEKLLKVANQIGNFGANKATDYISGGPSFVSDGAARMAKKEGGGQFSQDLASSLSKQLARFGVLDHEVTIRKQGGKFIRNTKFMFRPRLSGIDLPTTGKLSFPNFKTIKAMPAIFDATFRVTAGVLTGGAVGQTKAYLKTAKNDLQRALLQQQDLVSTVFMQKIYNKELQRLRRNYLVLKSQADRIVEKCRRAALKKSCGATLSASLDSAQANRNNATGSAAARRDQATRNLTEARATWLRLMNEVGVTHATLREARDGVLETELMVSNRDKISQLATGAGSASVRAKYRKQLDDLNTRKPLAEQKRTVKELETQRQELWGRIDKQRALVSQVSQTALTAYSETAEIIDKAERAYFAAVSKARGILIDCLGQTEQIAKTERPGLKKLRQATGAGTLLPPDIFFPVNTAFADLSKLAGQTKIATITKPGSDCQKMAASGLDGCWYDVSRSDSDDRSRPVIIKTSGNRISVDYQKTKRLYTGTITGDAIKLSYRISGPVELARFRWGTDGGKAPPLKVLRQVYPKYPVSRSTLKISPDSNLLTGQSHGAYITWGKESLQLSSFTPRDYPEKLVRDHGLKIRSIIFTGADGKKRSMQSLNDSRFAVAKASSGCAHVVDTIRVQSYVNNEKDKFVWDVLTETGPNTLEFRSDLPALRSLISRMDPRRVTAITLFDPQGLRGSVLKIRPKRAN